MRQFVFAALMAAGSLPNIAVAQTPTAQELSDARAIIDAQAGHIRRWERPPQLVIVQDQPIDAASVDATLDFIRSATGLALPAPRYIDLSADAAFFTETRFALAQSDTGITSTLTLGAQAVQADLFLFHLSPARASHLMLLTSTGGHNMSLARQYAAGTGPCYYSTLSNAAGMVNGLVFLDPTRDPAFIDLCIYEELVQAMGLVNDAHDSPWFTFDNLPTDKPRDYDARLLAALYDRSLASDAAVEDVLAIYAETGTGTDAASIAD